MTFELDVRIAAATLPLGETDLTLVRMMNDRRYPWIVLVPRRPAVSEWFELDVLDRHALTDQAALLAARMAEAFDATKMNVATLGNKVSQFHLHIVARRIGDAAWPDGVWNGTAAIPYAARERDAMQERLRALL